ncbi:MAG: hypothetical protein ACFFAE_11920 [Candidatus Hodarchaeota archaeon]
MAIPQEVVIYAFIQIAWFLAIISFIIVIQRDKVKQLRFIQASTQKFFPQLLYNRFLILFGILILSQSLLFIESLWLVWYHFTGLIPFPDVVRYSFWILIPLINGEWIEVYISNFINFLGLGIATSFLYFYYDNYCCKFRMKGIPALVNLGGVIIWSLYMYLMNPIINIFLNLIYFTAIGLVCIHLFHARKSVPHVGILLVSFVSAVVFNTVFILISFFFLDILNQSQTLDIWQNVVIITFIDLVTHVGYYTIIIAGILVFLKKRYQDLPIVPITEDITKDLLEG